MFDSLSDDKSVVNSKLYGFIPLVVSSSFYFFLNSYKSASLGVIPLLYLDPPDKSLVDLGKLLFLVSEEVFIGDYFLIYKLN